MKRVIRIATRRMVDSTTCLLVAAVGCGHLDPSRERPSSRPVASTSQQATANAATTALTPATVASNVVAAPNTSATSSAVAAPTQTLSADPQPCRLLAVGDSLTDPKSHGGGYLRVVERRCDCTVNNLGRGGDMVNQMKKRLLAHLAANPPRYSHVLVFGGVNDLYSDETAHRTVAKIQGDLEAMYRAARNRGASVIGVTVAPWGGFRRYFSPRRAETTLELNRWIAEGPKRGLSDYWVDAYSRLSCGIPTELCARYAAPHRDGLHFGPIGHERLGEALVEALGPTRCRRDPVAGSAGQAEGRPPEDVQ